MFIDQVVPPPVSPRLTWHSAGRPPILCCTGSPPPIVLITTDTQGRGLDDERFCFAHRVVDRAIGVLRARDPAAPLFLAVELDEPHGPYICPPPFQGRYGRWPSGSFLTLVAAHAAPRRAIPC